MSDDQIHASAACHVGGVRSHASFKLAISADSNTGQIPDFSKRAIAIVVKQKIRHVIVGDENVLPAIVVIIESHHAKTVPGFQTQA